MDNVERYVLNGETALLVSYGYGAGWSTWNSPELAYDKRIVEWLFENAELEKQDDDSYLKYEVVDVDIKELKEFLESIGYKDVYCGGVDGLCIQFVPQGRLVRIDEYDGAESIDFFYVESYFLT